MDLGVSQISPSDWGARVDYDSWRDASQSVRMIFIHWPGTDQKFIGTPAESRQALRSYENYHMNTLKWRGLGYDYAIDMEGRFYRVRGLAQSAATGGDLKENGIPNNVESDAILLLIGPNQKMSAKMQKTLETVCKHHRNPREVWGHRESRQFGTGTATTCPGPDNMRWVRGWRAGTATVPPEPPVEEKDDELAKLNEEAQEWLQDFYEEAKAAEARPSSLFYALSWLRNTRQFFSNEVPK